MLANVVRCKHWMNSHVFTHLGLTVKCTFRHLFLIHFCDYIWCMLVSDLNTLSLLSIFVNSPAEVLFFPLQTCARMHARTNARAHTHAHMQAKLSDWSFVVELSSIICRAPRESREINSFNKSSLRETSCHPELQSLRIYSNARDLQTIRVIGVVNGEKFNELLHTRVSGAGLFRGFAGLSCSYAVACQDSELVLHPWTQVGDSGWQLLPPEQLRNWKTSQE